MEDGKSAGDEIDVELGLTLLRLWYDQRVWVLRKSEAIELVDDYTLRRSVRLEIDPARAVGAGSKPSPVLPLLLLRKQPVPWLEVTDESGNRIPFHTPPEAMDMSVSIVAALAGAVLGDACSPETSRLLGAVVRASDPHDATVANADLNRAKESHPEVKRLLEDESFSAVLLSLERGTILFAPLRDQRRHVVTCSYLDNLQYPPLVRRLQQSMGWARLPLRLDLPATGDSPTFELYVAAPSGFRIVDTRFETLSSGSTSSADVRVARLQDRVQFLVSTQPGDRGIAMCTIRPARAGLVRMMALSCAMIAAVLTIVQRIGLREIVDFGEATSILLAVPGVVGLVSAQSNEHPFFTKRMAGLRAVVSVCAVTSYAAAFQIATGVTAICLNDSLCLRPQLSWWVLVSWVCVVLLLPAFVTAGPGRAELQTD